MKDFIIRKKVLGRFCYYLAGEMLYGKINYYWTGLKDNALPLSKESKGWMLKDIKEKNFNDIVEVIKRNSNSDVSG